jgi:hypothetical protein
MATCCPRESQQIPQVNFSPERRSQQREEPGERVIPAAHHAQKAHQDVEQQRSPDLPADRVGAVAQEIAQLQALLDLFKKHFDLPTAAIQTSHTPSAPREIIGQELHLALLALNLHQSPDPAHRFGIIGAGVLVFEHHKLVAQDALIRCLWQVFYYPETERFLAAGDPEDPIVIEHTQVHEINVCAVKDNDLAGLNCGAEFRGANAIGSLGRFDQYKTR